MINPKPSKKVMVFKRDFQLILKNNSHIVFYTGVIFYRIFSIKNYSSLNTMRCAIRSEFLNPKNVSVENT